MKNINTITERNELASVKDFIEINNKIFFSGAECTQSPEVYYINTEVDSVILHVNLWDDHRSPSWPWCGIDPVYIFDRADNFVEHDSFLFYVTNTEDYGRELWKTDGSPENIILVKDILKRGYGDPRNLYVFKNKIWFSADDGTYGRELWHSDGSSDGTLLFMDIEVGEEGSSPSDFFSYNGYLFFKTQVVNGLPKIWQTDGTIDNTIPIEYPDSLNHIDLIDLVFEFNGRLLYKMYSLTDKIVYLNTYDPIGQIWNSIDTFSFQQNGTLYIPSNFIKINGELFFTVSDLEHGKEIWTSDGTNTGTRLLYDIVPGELSSNPFFLNTVNDKLSFYTNINDTILLNISDSASNSFVVLDTLNTGTGGGSYQFKWKDKLWYVSENGNALWQTDGLQKKKAFGNFNFIHFEWIASGDNLYFTTKKDYYKVGIFKWNENIQEEPQLLKGINYIDGHSMPESYVEMQGDIYFAANDATNRNDIWKTKGDESTTKKIANNILVNSKIVKAKDSSLVFKNLMLNQGYSLWSTDGEYGNQKQIKSNCSGSTLAYTDGELAYFWDNGILISDGTSDGTFTLMQGARIIDNWTMFNDWYFSKAEIGGNYHLIRTDRTPSGTQLVVQLSNNYPSSDLIEYKNHLYFFKEDDNDDWGLWKTDGTEDGTSLLKNIPNPNSYQPRNLQMLNDKLIFWADDGIHGFEIWISDGTEIGTNMLFDFSPGLQSTWASSAVQYKDELFFTSYNESTGHELWKTDGTISGTSFFKDLFIGPESSRPLLNEAIIVDSTLFFSAFDNKNGRELWQSNGTPESTFIVQDICPGPCSSNPENLFPHTQNRFFFSAHSPIVGIEPWIYNPDGISSVNESFISDKSNFLTYPNPSNGNEINILLKKENNINEIRLINLNGQIIQKNKIEINSELIQLKVEKQIPAGIYFVQFFNENKVLQGVEKIFIAK